MIEKISLKIASYKEVASLETDKKINLIYGLNGSGKSTLSEFLRHCHENDNDKYTSCSVQPQLGKDEKVLVYNQKWVNENFYVNPELKGIFSLSKENVDAKKVIDQAKHEKSRLENLEAEKNSKLEESKAGFLRRKNNVLDSIWKIKSTYAGRATKTEYCLKGLMGSREALFNYLLNVKKPECIPPKNIDAISKEIASMLDEHVAKIERIAEIEFCELNEREKALLRKEITGSENYTFSTLIDDLKNSDWVNSGIKYIESRSSAQKCPFCQPDIDRERLLANLKMCFDKSYESDKAELGRICDSYRNRVEALSENPIFNTQNLLQEFSGRYKVAFVALRKV
ncbi:MAG: AAA family ATPase, partial [Opitutales bacterium]|nr:AAA family ATPase [Opitutales bacterium]